jgi:hypothetical protein
MDSRDMAELRFLLKGVMHNEEAKARASQQRQAMCSGKRRFNTFAQAERAVKRMARAHDGCVFQSYACSVCRGYHTAEKIPGQNKRPMKEITHG